jgi:archaellin
VKWQSILIIIFLALSVIVSGCTDEATPGSGTTAPPPGEPVKPGQTLQLIGDVSGEGQLGGALVSGTIDTLTFAVGLVPGAKSIEMANVSIVYADAIRTETLVPVQGGRGDPPQGAWGILSVVNEVGKPNNRLEDQEQFVIRINPRAPLVPRQLITISLKTPTSTPLTIRRVAPPTIMDNNILLPL